MSGTNLAPILLVAAKPSLVKGLYDATVYVFAKTKAEAVGAFARLFSGHGAMTDAFQHKKSDLGRDPYLGMAYGTMERTKGELDALRRVADGSYVARSAKATSRNLADGLHERRPLNQPTEAMWRAALKPHGFGEPPSNWLVRSIMAGAQDPDKRIIEEAYRLMGEENARRRKL
jgi:hypothetical protein